MKRIIKTFYNFINESEASFKVIKSEWSEIPNAVSGYLVSANLVEIRSSTIPNGESLKTYFTANKNILTAIGYVSFTNNGVNYLLAVDIDNGQVGSGECTIEKGTAEEFNNYYGNGKAPSYNMLPQGSTEYIIIKTYDASRSLLGALKKKLLNDKPCWTYLSKSLTDKYKHLSNCWK
jgi:hypothetical protein